MLPLYGGPVQSLMGELRSHKLCEVDYRILKKEERKTSFFRRHSVHSISFPKCSNSINLIQNFCHWQWKIVNIRIIHLYFSSHVQCKSRAVRDAESTYLNQRAFWLIALDVFANFSSEKCTGKWERRKQSCFETTLFPEYPPMCSPLSLPVFFVIAQAWVPRSGPRTVSRCDVSRVWTKAAWSWGASFRFLFPTVVTGGERQQKYKMTWMGLHVYREMSVFVISA